MPESANPVINITDLNQVCLIVYDIDQKMAALWETFGIGPWDVYRRDFTSTVEEESIRDMTYYGRPAKFSYHMAVTRQKLGGLHIELIQPVAGDSIHRDFLEENGEGLQHIGWHRVDSHEEFKASWKRLEQSGYRCLMSGRVYQAAFAYFDTRSVLHTILELVWLDPAKSAPPPVRVFP